MSKLDAKVFSSITPSNFQWTNFDNIPNNVVAKNSSNYVLYAKATDYTEPNDFKASLANTYLYYEKA